MDEYLGMLKLAKRSLNTVNTYRKVLLSYARFLDVPLDEIHNHLVPENLIKYAANRSDKSETGIRLHLSILHRYFEINGIGFDPLELNVLKARREDERDDKPLTMELLQKMMDLGNPHTRAMISVLISTGMRAGEFCQLLVSDVKGDTIHIRPEIAKGRKGGNVYLTAEAREYLNLWLKNRGAYIQRARSRHFGRNLPERDDRLFAVTYNTLLVKFSRLYDAVDGEQGKYYGKITPHATRRYFRTHAVKTMDLDLVERIMRHTGYLTSAYVRISEEEARKAFHAGEAALYITRKDQRIAQSEIDRLRSEKEELEAALSGRMALMEKRMEELTRKGK